jgi:hypothetical protein
MGVNVFVLVKGMRRLWLAGDEYILFLAENNVWMWAAGRLLAD